MLKKAIHKIYVIMMICTVLLSQVSFASLHVHAESADLKTTVEQQVRAFAKSINFSNADDAAARALASHGLTGRGKDLNVGNKHSLTATLMNAEMTQDAVSEGVAYLIELMQDFGDTETYGFGNLNFYGSDASNDSGSTGYVIYSSNSKNEKRSGIDHSVVNRRKYHETNKLNGYDTSLEWIAGCTRFYLTVKIIKESYNQVTYQVQVDVSDRFDFSTSGNDGFKNLISGIGSILFKEYDWKSTSTFNVTVPVEPCSHQSSSYTLTYHPETKTFTSSNGNEAELFTTTTTSGTEKYYFELDDAIVLRADQPWVMEYDVKNFYALELSAVKHRGSEKYPSIRHYRGSKAYVYQYDCITLSDEIKNEYNFASDLKWITRTYEANLKDISCNNNNTYTYRYENIIDSKGNNKVYLTVLDPNTGIVYLERRALDSHYEKKSWENDGKSTLVAENSNDLNGKDLYFKYIGSNDISFNPGAFELRVWENGIDHASDSSYVAGKTVKPTCTTDGYTVYTCTKCGDSYNCDIVKALGHDYRPVTTDATCTEDGYVTHTCTRCKTFYKEEGAEKLGHLEVIDAEAVDATCIEAGSTESSHCERCGEILSEAEPVEALGHDYESVVSEPTCEEAGYTTHTCTRCEDVYTDNEVEALGHEFGQWELIEIPTEEKDGLERRDCVRCDAYETQIVEYVPHSYVTEVIDPTCTSQGYTVYTCTECGFSYEDDYTEMIDHDYDEWFVEIEPTHNTEGVERRNCKHCEAYETKSIEVEEHKYSTEVIAPTCTEEGYTLYTCECGETYKDDFVGVAAHHYGESEVVVEATCLEGGLKKHSCTECGHEEEIQVEPLGHKYATTVIKPTCTEGGYTEHQCERCEEAFVDDYTDATGHTYGEWTAAVEATCLEGGLEMQDCEDCDHYQTRETEALGHDHQPVITAPDCKNDGYTTYTCTRCEDAYVEDIVPSSGHGYTEWTVVIESDCHHEGVEKRSCTGCEQEETRVIEKTEHEAVIDEAIEATCTETGLSEGSHCGICGDVLISQEITEELGHDYEDEVVNPTCSMAGYTVHTCTRCEDSYMDSYVQMIEHSYGEWEIIESPTLEKEGLERRECVECGYYQTRTMPKSEHKYTSVNVKPTCEEQGYTEYTCTECGSSYKDNYVEALGHEFSEWVVTDEPTCRKLGVKRHECEVCGKIEIDTIDPVPHDYSNVITEPTCTEMGYTTHTCTMCKSQMEDTYVPANGHTFGEWVVLGEVQCLEKGAERRDCEICDVHETREIELVEHDYEAVITDATCLEKGHTTYTCTRCGDSYTDTEVEALGHDMSEWTVTVEASCLEAGEEISECSRCDYSETRTVDALGHDFGQWTVVTKASCGKAGEEHSVCTRCDEFESRVIEALTHNYVDKVTAATCTSSGLKVNLCEHCGDVKSEEEISALGHSWSNRTVKPTCTKSGYDETYCTNCSESKKSNEKAALGHSFGEYISDDNATADQDGTKTAKCSTCGSKDTVIETGTKKVIVSIEMTKSPDKLNYELGEELDFSDLELTVTYADETTEVITDYEIMGYDPQKSGEQEVAVSYRDYIETLKVTVGEAEDEEMTSDVPTDTEPSGQGGLDLGGLAAVPVLGGMLGSIMLFAKKLFFKKKIKVQKMDE